MLNKLHRIVACVIGALLASLLFIRVSAVLIGRALLGLDTNFYFAATGKHMPPFQRSFVPYYFPGIFCIVCSSGKAFHWRARRGFSGLSI